MIGCCEGVIFPSQAVVHSKLGSYLPTVAHIHGPCIPAQGIWIIVLNGFTDLVRQAQQKLSHRIGFIRRRPAQQSGHVAPKPEGAAWGLKGSALRLKMIHPVAGVLYAKPQAMPPFLPTQVSVGHVLVIAEQEWIAGVRVSQGVPAALGKNESRCALR